MLRKVRYSVFFWLSLLFPHTIYGETLSMGWEDWKPYQYQTDQGELTGLDIDMVRAVFSQYGQSVEFVQLPWKRTLSNVETGRIDLAASASKTPERQEYAHFSNPYRTESASLFIRKSDQDKYVFSSLSDIIGTDFSLAVTRGYYYGEEFSRLMKDEQFRSHIQEVNDNQLAQRQLVRGRVDGFLEDPIAASVELQEEGVLDLVVKALDVYSDDIYVMFSKKTLTQSEVDQFNKGLAEIRENGEYDRIMSDYSR